MPTVSSTPGRTGVRPAAEWKPNEVEFFVARYLAKKRHASPRCYGVSSDALADYALGIAAKPTPFSFPSDSHDLAACQLTYDMAPERLKVVMLPVLVEYRAHVEERSRQVAETLERQRVARMHAPATSHQERSQQAGMVVPCPYCKAPVGEWCHVVGKPDHFATWAHTPRENAALRLRSMRTAS